MDGPDLDGLEASFADALDAARYLGRPVLYSVSRPVSAGADPLALLDAIPRGDDAFFWGRPGLAIAGTAPCVEIPACAEEGVDGDRFERASSECHRLFSESVVDGWQRPFALGGFRYTEAGERAPEWRGFPAATLAVPATAVVRRRGVVFGIVCRLVCPDSSESVVDGVRASVEALAAPATARGREVVPSAIVARDWLPEPSAWAACVGAATAAIERGEIEKVVLARRQRLSVSASYDDVAVVGALRARFPGCFTYLFRRDGASFLGASPELLVARTGNRVRSFPLAGTIKRGATPAEAARALMADPKERREHRLVVEAVTEALTPVCTQLRAPGIPSTLRAGAMLHLGTRISGHLLMPRSVVELAGLLHPTPAVGGTPWPAAEEALLRLEGFDRGWYAGPVGWVDAEGDGEFAIALRCALLRGNTATLFAGAGIVAGSKSAPEVAETELKMRSMLAALEGARSM